jgi:integration host factor subunit alpha
MIDNGNSSRVSGTLDRADLARIVAREMGVSQAQGKKLVSDMLRHISGELVRGEKVLISGFGSFQVWERQASRGHNVRTGEEVHIPPRRVVTFKPSEDLRRRINTDETTG